MRDKIIYIDFDGTIQENGYPEIGNLNEFCSEMLWELHDLGVKLILNTYRADLENGSLEAAIEFIKIHNLPITCWNTNKIKPKPFNPLHKEIFIDDESESCPLKLSDRIYNKKVVCWVTIRKAIMDSI
ncbi:hypothetical protein [Flavobacterium sp. W22_SRS_FP1]|uniref:hypothetical protein n=1 Tax=Flavobacterium sp. W22_SRS_FP1 TaxID=3240276 RepID=UPI003F93191F